MLESSSRPVSSLDLSRILPTTFSQQLVVTLAVFLVGLGSLWLLRPRPASKHSGHSTPLQTPTTPTPTPSVDQEEARLKDAILREEQQITIYNNQLKALGSGAAPQDKLNFIQLSIPHLKQRDTATLELGRYYLARNRKAEAADLFRRVYKSQGEQEQDGRQAREHLIEMHEPLE